MTPSNFDELLKVAWNKRRVGEYTEAKQLLEEAVDSCDTDDHDSLGRIFHMYAQFESDHNHHPEALKWYRKSIEHYKVCGDRMKIAHSMRHIADLESELDNLPEAEILYQSSIEHYRSSSQGKLDLANALRGYGLLLEKKRDINGAVNIWNEARALYYENSVEEGVTEAEEQLKKLSELI